LGYVRILQSKETLTRMQQSVFFVNMVVSLSFALVFLALVRMLATRLTRPLAELSATMLRAERGEPDVQARVTGPSDIEAMASAFNHMITVLHEREGELARHRDHLEELVSARTAELREAKERAEDANRAKTVFLSRMSHELRTPLNAILGYAQVLRLDKQLASRHAAALDTIRNSGDHLLTLIVDILDLSKIEAGRAELYPAPIDMPAFLRGVADIIRIKAEEKKLAFVLDAAASLPDTVLGDEKRVRQVLLNLLGNAVKFTDAGQVRLVATVLSDENGIVRLRFEIQDTGIGIAADLTEQIFQPFEQAGDTGRRFGGTGLGLAISRQLARMMNGDIVVQSELGQGSVFRFEATFTKCQPAASSAPMPSPVGYQGRRRQILVVDDVEANRRMLGDLLEALGFEIAEAPDGEQALQAVNRIKPDLVLMDMAMPVMDGPDATRRLREQNQWRNLPVILISANATPADEQNCLSAGATAFMSKPVNRDRLLELMGNCLKLRWRFAEVESGKAA
jgi:signal transduction histidine kinase